MRVIVCYCEPDIGKAIYDFDATPIELQELLELSAMDESPGAMLLCRARLWRFLEHRPKIQLNFHNVTGDCKIFFFSF